MKGVRNIAVIGLGYIGLPTAAAFANAGVKVLGVDIKQDAVDIINRGQIHIVEPELGEIVKRVVSSGHLKATKTLECADAFLIAVPTPFSETERKPDLSYVEAAGRSVAKVLKPGNLVVLESTSPIGTTEKLAQWMADERPDLTFPHQVGNNADISIAHCPERVLPGQVMRELVSNERVIGGMTTTCAQKAVELYKIFVKAECITTDAKTAEMCKLVENASRDVSIAFANELSIICDKLGVNVWELRELANRHPRVNILEPGAGVGGHCIAVDPWFIVASDSTNSRLIRMAREINDGKPNWVLNKVYSATEDFLSSNSGYKPTIAVLGLSFKPDIDDIRESPALQIAKSLHHIHQERLLIVEPNLSELPPGFKTNKLFTLEEAIKEADIYVILVKHSNFQKLKNMDLDPKKMIIDATGLLTS